MEKQVIVRDARIQLCEEVLCSHFPLRLKVHITKNKPCWQQEGVAYLLSVMLSDLGVTRRDVQRNSGHAPFQ
jgi:hypothetical protein